MKRGLLVTIATLFAVSLLAVGCGETKPEPKPQPEPAPEVLILVTEKPEEADYFYNFMLAFNLSKVAEKVTVVFASYGTYAGQRGFLAERKIEKPELLMNLTGIEAATLEDFALALQEKQGVAICLCMACPVRYGFSEGLEDSKWADPVFKAVKPSEVAEMIARVDKVIAR